MAYRFTTRGDDASAIWIAYGETLADVDATTTSVTLALQTLIDAATLEAAPFIDAIAASQSVDLLLRVTAPGGYAVPTADYAVTYSMASTVGSVTAQSKLGARVQAHDTPTSDDFAVTATIDGWRNVAGEPVWVSLLDSVTVTYEVAFTIPTGLGFDTTAPVATIVAPTTGAVGSPLALSGNASDDVALDRVQVYAGPVLIASSDAAEAVAPVGLLQLDADAWSFDWTPTEARSHTFTAVAIDSAGNEHRASASVEVEAAAPTTLTFVDFTATSASVTVGETVILSGAAFAGFNPNWMELVYSDGHISTLGVEVVNGVWTLPWTVPANALFIEYRYHDSFNPVYSWIELH